MERGLRIAPTPNRQRNSTGASRKSTGKNPAAAAKGRASQGSRQAGEASTLPKEARSLQWPNAFVQGPKGERLEFQEGGVLATRVSGVGFGTALVGPLNLEKGTAYFEVEVAELEPKRSQTMAMGIYTTPPVEGRVARAERSSSLGSGAYLLGYDLPKVFANGTEVAKIGTKQWRPLKEIAKGDIIGLLIQRATSELTVFVNGEQKTSAVVPTPDGSKWPTEIWGIVDVQGTVRSVRLRGPAVAKQRRQLTREATVQMPPPSAATPARAVKSASTQDMDAPTPCFQGRSSGSSAASTAGRKCAEEGTASQRGVTRKNIEAGGRPKKRMRLNCFPSGSMVHLIRDSGEVIQVPRQGDFVIGRNPKSCNLALDSPDLPNMVSRRHAVIVSAEDAVMIVDCESVNGTYVNGRRIGRETLRQGDELVFGNPAQSSSVFKLTVAMPPSA